MVFDRVSVPITNTDTSSAGKHRRVTTNSKISSLVESTEPKAPAEGCPSPTSPNLICISVVLSHVHHSCSAPHTPLDTRIVCLRISSSLGGSVVETFVGQRWSRRKECTFNRNNQLCPREEDVTQTDIILDVFVYRR